MIVDARTAARDGAAEVERQAKFYDDYAELNTASLTVLGDRLSAPISTVPPFLPSWARRCRGFGGGKGWANGWYVVVGGKTGMGKALALETPIPTPGGWTTMGDLALGDEVIDDKGRPCRVVGATEVLTNRRCFSLRFDDGTVIVADAAHEWVTQTATSDPAVWTTEEIAANLRIKSRLHRVPCTLPLMLAPLPYDVPPYVLGAWLGDGDSRNAALTSHVDDAEEMAALIRAAGETVAVRYSLARPTVARLAVGSVKTCRRGHALLTPGVRCRPCAASKERAKRAGVERGDPWVAFTLKERLRRLGVLQNKHLPVRYLRGSYEQRLALLRGLMDTDGYVSETGQCEFTSTRHALAVGVLDLLLSLGIKAKMYERRATLNGADVGPKFRIHFVTPTGIVPFALARKARRVRAHRSSPSTQRSIVAVTPCASVPVRCIEVDSPSHLYLATRSYIPTHNSILGGNALAKAVLSSVTAALHSTEMEFDDNAVRALAILTGTDTWKLEPGELFSREHYSRALATLEEICESTGARLVTNRKRRRRLQDVEDGIRAAWEIHGARFHVVDYMQLIGTGTAGYYSEDVNARIAEVSDHVMRVTEDCGVVTMALSQLNREGLKADRRPEPYMLHGGSALENDARQVALMDHTRMYEAVDPKDGGWNGWLILAKNRHGPAGIPCDIPIHVSRRTLRVRERLDDEVMLGEKIEPNRPKPKG